jgi:HK97 family phage major capsid protein
MTIPRSLADLSAQREVTGRVHAAIAFALGKGVHGGNVEGALTMLRRDPSAATYADALEKAAVSAFTTQGANAGGPLAAMRAFAQAFLPLVRPRTFLGQLIGTISAPLNVRMGAQLDTEGVADFVPESGPTPVAALSVETRSLPPTKLAIIAPFTKELARTSNPNALIVVQSDLVRRIALGTDIATLDPTRAAIANERPASLTHEATEVTASGDLPLDIARLLAAISSGQAAAPHLAMSVTVALYLCTLRGSGGERLFPDLGLVGGRIFGVPVIVCSAGIGNLIVAVDASGIVLADEGVELDAVKDA